MLVEACGHGEEALGGSAHFAFGRCVGCAVEALPAFGLPVELLAAGGYFEPALFGDAIEGGDVGFGRLGCLDLEHAEAGALCQCRGAQFFEGGGEREGGQAVAGEECRAADGLQAGGEGEPLQAVAGMEGVGGKLCGGDSAEVECVELPVKVADVAEVGLAGGGKFANGRFGVLRRHEVREEENEEEE